MFDALNRPWFLRLSFVVLLALVFYGLFRPTPFSVPFHQADKIAHVGMFMSLGILSRLIMPKVSPYVFWCVFFGLAASSEYFQHWWLPARVFSLSDVLANIVGAVLALCLIKLMIFAFAKSEANKASSSEPNL